MPLRIGKYSPCQMGFVIRKRAHKVCALKYALHTGPPDGGVSQPSAFDM